MEAVKAGQSITRIGFLGVENIRLFIGVKAGRPVLEPFIKEEQHWAEYRKPLQLRVPNIKRMCLSEEEFEAELVDIFFKAFPRAEEAFYDALPSHDVVLSELSANPTLAQVEESMFVYFLDDDFVEEADGVIVISCGDGNVCIPYEGEGESLTFQMYRAKFHPDSPVLNAFTSFFDRVDDIKSRLSSITLTGVLRRIDGLVK